MEILLVLSILIICVAALAVVITAGVVCRVEKELDISYKFLLGAIIFFFLAEASDFYFAIENKLLFAIMVKGSRLLSVTSFLIGVFFMRDITRKIDGEKK